MGLVVGSHDRIPIGGNEQSRDRDLRTRYATTGTLLCCSLQLVAGRDRNDRKVESIENKGEKVFIFFFFSKFFFVQFFSFFLVFYFSRVRLIGV